MSPNRANGRSNKFNNTLKPEKIITNRYKMLGFVLHPNRGYELQQSQLFLSIDFLRCPNYFQQAAKKPLLPSNKKPPNMFSNIQI